MQKIRSKVIIGLKAKWKGNRRADAPTETIDRITLPINAVANNTTQHTQFVKRRYTQLARNADKLLLAC